MNKTKLTLVGIFPDTLRTLQELNSSGGSIHNVIRELLGLSPVPRGRPKRKKRKGRRKQSA